MYGTKRSDDRVLLDGHVTGQRGRIGHDHVVSDVTVMRDMGVGHDQAVASNPGQPGASRRATVDRHALADYVVVADFEARLLAFELQVLRLQPQGRKREYAVVVADFGGAAHHDVR